MILNQYNHLMECIQSVPMLLLSLESLFYLRNINNLFQVFADSYKPANKSVFAQSVSAHFHISTAASEYFLSLRIAPYLKIQMLKRLAGCASLI